MSPTKYPIFSIVTVTLNNHQGLIKTAKSVEKQTYHNFEWIVIDGQSSDQTLDFLKEKRSAERTKEFPFAFYSEKDDGIYDAMNLGISKAKGKYILFLNAGDQLADDSVLEKIAPYASKNPDFIYGDALEPLQGDKYHYKKSRRYKDLKWGMITHHQSMFYNRLTIRDNKLHYSLLYKIAADYDFTIRYLKISKKSMYFPHAVCIFEQGGISQQQDAIGRKEQFIIRERLEIVAVPMNLFIICIQAISITMRRKAPRLYHLLRSL